MGNLIRNERLKLYKKPSTWILTGIIVALSLVGLIFSHLLLGSSYEYDWRMDYENQLENCTMWLKEDPGDLSIARQVEEYTYLLDNEIPPSDWRSTAVSEYFDMKYSNIVYDETGEGSTVAEPDEETGARMERLKPLIEQNDWRGYVEGQIADLESGYTPSASEEEKQVAIEVYNLQLEYDVPPSGRSTSLSRESDWRAAEIDSIFGNKLALVQGEYNGALLTRHQRAELEQANAVSLRRLATGTAPVGSQSFLGLLESTATSMELITLLLIVFAGGMISTEFGTGTIKLLLITPHRRKKIFWAKAAILLEITLITVGAVFLFAFLLSGIFTGFSGIGDMQVMTLFGRVVRFPYLLYIVMKMLLLLLPVLAYGALALMLSAVTRKSAVAIAVSLLLMFGSEIIMALISAYTMYGGGVIPGIKFLFFANTSLGTYLPSASGSISAIMGGSVGATVDGTMTLGFSVAVLLVYTACFLWIARDSFCRRDVK